MDDIVNRVIDAAYATAIDFRFSVSLGAALRAMPDNIETNETILAHLTRARKIASERSHQAIYLASLTFTESLNSPEIRGTPPFHSTDCLKQISAPNGNKLVSPASWAAVMRWLDPMFDDDAPLRLVFDLKAPLLAHLRNASTTPLAKNASA